CCSGPARSTPTRCVRSSPTWRSRPDLAAVPHLWRLRRPSGRVLGRASLHKWDGRPSVECWHRYFGGEAMSDVPFWGPDFGALQEQDAEIAAVVLGELDRLRTGLQLIASENFTSPAVLAALGSTLSNKYAEGYPKRRYYGGCGVVDDAEEIGIARAKQLFGTGPAKLH